MTQQSHRTSWTFLTNHGHVLGCLAAQPDARARDVALLVGITERATQAIIADLVACGYLTRLKRGRRNRYIVHTGAPLRHPLESDRTIGDLLAALGRFTPADGPLAESVGAREPMAG
jgi:hypothetical protein